MAVTGVLEKLVENKIEETYTDKHFTKIAFAISTIALLLFSPMTMLSGATVGFAIHYCINPNPKLEVTDKIITVPNTVFAIIGATGAFIGLTPAGYLAGWLFRVIPFFSSFAIGSTAYRALKHPH